VCYFDYEQKSVPTYDAAVLRKMMIELSFRFRSKLLEVPTREEQDIRDIFDILK
jgi:hypothetical protein